MPLEIRERELPGVGIRYELDLTHEESVATVIHNTGRRGLYYRHGKDGDYERVMELSDSQARALGLVLVGAYYQPVPAQAGSVTPADEHTKWYQIHPDSPVIGKTLADLEIDGESEGPVVLAVLRSGERTAHPPATFELKMEDHLVVIGEQSAHERLIGILHGVV